MHLKPVVPPQLKVAADEGKVKQKRKRGAKKCPAVHSEEAASVNVCIGDLLNRTNQLQSPMQVHAFRYPTVQDSQKQRSKEVYARRGLSEIVQ